MITYKNVSVLDYTSERRIIIPHIVNHSNQLGSGVALAIAKKYPQVKSEYHAWANRKYHRFMLGQIQCVNVSDVICVINMLAQATPRGDTINGVYLPPIRYDCLKECMLRVAELSSVFNADIAMPLFSCGLAGGSLDRLLTLVNEVWSDINVTICIPDVKEYNKCLNIS